MNITQILCDQVDLRPDATAIYAATGDLTYAELGRRVATVSAGLDKAGVLLGDVVAIRLDDPVDHWIATLAIAHVGGTVISVPRSMPEAQRDRIFQMTGCAKVLSGDEYSGADALAEIYDISYSLAQAAQSDGVLRPASVDPAQPWIFANGSGSTGQPKIIPCTHETEMRRTARQHFQRSENERYTIHSMIGIHFLAGKRINLKAILFCDAIHTSRVSIEKLCQKVEEEKVNIIYATPYHAEKIISQTSSHDTPIFSKLHILFLSSATISADLRKRAASCLTPQVHIIYGSNESSVVSIARPKDVFQNLKSVGHICDDVDIEIVDDFGNLVPSGKQGLIRIKTDTQINGYHGDPEATAKAFRDGWYYPGDVGYFLPDGQLAHLGRADDMMIVSGVNLFPAEVEECLRQVSGVLDVAVRPLPHKQLQDLPVALVVVAASARLDAKELVQSVRDQIGKHALYDVEFVERLPINEQGKLPRSAFAEVFRKKWDRLEQKAPSPAKPKTAELQKAKPIRSVSFKLPADVKAEDLVAWIACLDADLAPLTAQEARNRSQNEAYAWFSSVLDLTVCFLQTLRVPIFDRFEIVGFKRAPGAQDTLEVAFLMPRATLVSGDLVDKVFKVAFKVALWVRGKRPEAPTERAQFFQAITNEVVTPFSDATAKGKSTFQVLRAAYDLGIPYFPLPNGVYQLGLGAHGCRIHRSTTDQDSAFGATWSKNKLVSAALLREAGLPAPDHVQVSTPEAAQDVSERFGYPVVVKPADLERGEGVSVDVGAAELNSAFQRAHECSPGKAVIVERQIAGTCHRLFVVRGALLYAVQRLPIGVYANGVSTVIALVDAECAVQEAAPPWKRSGIRPVDDLAQISLKNAGLSPDAVPMAGTFVPLRRIETTAWGGVDEDVTDTIHPENTRLAIAVANLFGLDVAGVDLISTDITQPWHATGAAINEINFAPLLGGGDISKRHLSEYLERILVNMGRIPIHVHTGGEQALSRARAQWDQLRLSGLNAVLLCAQDALDGKGHAQALCAVDLEARAKALMLRRDVQAIVVVAPTTEDAQKIEQLARL